MMLANWNEDLSQVAFGAPDPAEELWWQNTMHDYNEKMQKATELAGYISAGAGILGATVAALLTRRIGGAIMVGGSLAAGAGAGFGGLLLARRALAVKYPDRSSYKPANYKPV